MAAAFVKFKDKPEMEVIKRKWAEFSGKPQELSLPTAPKQFLHYF
jgi:aspartate-semialdehyde dehydrogenase